MSPKPLVSPGTRFVAWLAKAPYRPSALITGSKELWCASPWITTLDASPARGRAGLMWFARRCRRDGLQVIWISSKPFSGFSGRRLPVFPLLVIGLRHGRAGAPPRGASADRRAVCHHAL